MSKRCAFQLQMYENRVEIIVILMCTSATVPRRFIEREKEEKIHILKVGISWKLRTKSFHIHASSILPLLFIFN